MILAILIYISIILDAIFVVAAILWFLVSGIWGIVVFIGRLHDFNRSGWWYLLLFIPIFGALVAIVVGLMPGTKGPNKYGPDPRL